MSQSSRDHVTTILAKTGPGPEDTTRLADELLPTVYEELRSLARRLLAHERPGHTLQPTALVHEAYLRLVDGTKVPWSGRTHFFAVGARAMRRVLVDHARNRGRKKRGGSRAQVTLSDAGPIDQPVDLHDLITLNDALTRLEALDPRQAKIVEMRCYGALTMDEIAQQVGVSKRTVEGDWAHALAWLRREISRTDEHA